MDQEEDICLLKTFLDLQALHKHFFKDLDLMELDMEFDEDIEDFRKLVLRERFRRFVKSNEFSNLKIAFARILATKPHSADVESA